MELSTLKGISIRIEQGAWIDASAVIDGLKIKTRGIGNSDYQRLRSKLISSLPADKKIKGDAIPEALDQIETKLLIETCLQDWNLTEDGATVPCNLTSAEKYLSEFRVLRDAVNYAAMTARSEQAEATGTDAKNS